MSNQQDHQYLRHRLAAISVLVGLAIIASAGLIALRITNPPPAGMPAEWVPCRDVLVTPNAFTDSECQHPSHTMTRLQFSDQFLCSCWASDKVYHGGGDAEEMWEAGENDQR